jgi:YidC/Oxa1 family membrane protein insertase
LANPDGDHDVCADENESGTHRPHSKTMFTWMPLIFTFMLAAFPAGLVIYWTWNNLLSILQQGYIMKKQGTKIELFDNLKGY